MLPIDASDVRQLLEALIAAFSTLGGAMAYTSGLNADKAMAEGQSAAVVARRVNEGIGYGFRLSWPVSVAAFAIMVVT